MTETYTKERILSAIEMIQPKVISERFDMESIDDKRKSFGYFLALDDLKKELFDCTRTKEICFGIDVSKFGVCILKCSKDDFGNVVLEDIKNIKEGEYSFSVKVIL